MINFNTFFFKTGDPIIKNFDFLKRFGTLHELLIDLLNEKVKTFRATKEQEELILQKILLIKKHKVLKKQRKKYNENKFLKYKEAVSKMH